MALLTLERLAGTMSDEDAALKLGIEPSEVRAWRASHGIKRYRRPRGGAPAEVVAPRGPTRLLRRKQGADEVEEILVAPPPPVTETTSNASEGETTMAAKSKKSSAAPAKGGRKSAAALLEGVKDKLGKLPDDQIAAEVGLSRGVVGAYRRTHNIPPYDGYLFQKGHAPLGPKTETKAKKPKAPPKPRKPKAAPEAPAPEAPKTTRTRGPRSRIEDYAHLLGVETDAEVARQAGVTRAAVSAWRRNRGIAASRAPGGVPREAAAPAVATPVAAPAPEPAPAPTTTARKPRKSAPSTGRFAFQVTASAGDRKVEFVAIGATMSDACGAAQSWLDARGDGTWRLDEVRHLSEAVL
ncbi:MAG: hypothetical protein H6738_04835 [Alphaproteobacteria bacterium]|nr:hypothetical protein [Alphaproteobacteria bacterium]MCB9696097.1 hypothetical protein [Alphaproteobacteria bacterium]